MVFTLAAALLASTALAIPLGPNPIPGPTNVTINARQAVVGKGQDSGVSISVYEKPNCQGASMTGQEMFYATMYPFQLQSYSLSDELTPDDVLSFGGDLDWTADGHKPVDPTLNFDQQACAQFAYNAEGDGLKTGCHSLPNVVGCVSIWVNQGPPQKV